jgi:hypothetical protein
LTSGNSTQHSRNMDDDSGAAKGTYEEANWARLSPTFRAAHNRLRQLRSMPTIPPPEVDLYVSPAPTAVRPFDPADPEAVAAAHEFNGPADIVVTPLDRAQARIALAMAERLVAGRRDLRAEIQHAAIAKYVEARQEKFKTESLKQSIFWAQKQKRFQVGERTVKTALARERERHRQFQAWLKILRCELDELRHFRRNKKSKYGRIEIRCTANLDYQIIRG